MKINFYLLSFFSVAVLASCSSDNVNSAEATSKDTLTSDSTIIETSIVSDAAYDLVIAKGGDKDTNQIVLEEMLAELNKSQAALNGTDDQKVLGHWVGSFGPNMINITITHLEGELARGYSVCAGNFRKLTGNFKREEGIFHFFLKEPGTDPYDGYFEFDINTTQLTLKGKWTPFVEKGNSPKKYELQQQLFQYDNSVGDFPQASQKLLQPHEVELFSPEELRIVRNQIYARHGYSFKNKDMRYTFEKQEWYMPMGIDVRFELTDIEIANIALIYEYETYYEEYGDTYGR
jgi:hypothetical protein